MIGAPQGKYHPVYLCIDLSNRLCLGRSDYGVDPQTVDMRPSLDIRGLDAYETDRSRQYAYFVRNAHHIRIITDIYHKVKKQKDWGADPRFTQRNPLFADWLRNLPPDLQVNYPPDGSPPPLAPVPFCGQYAFSLSLGNHPTSPTTASGIPVLYRWGRVEDPFLLVLFISQEPLSLTRGHFGTVWIIWFVIHATRDQLRHLLYSHLYHASPGKCWKTDSRLQRAWSYF